jgi:hypothetical protein
MNTERATGDAAVSTSREPAGSHGMDRERTGLDDPRALQILTTEHFGLMSTRTLGYQEMFGRTTIFVAALSGTIISLALLAQATKFGPEMLWFALVLISVLLFIGLGTFVRSVVINFEEARWVAALNLVHQAYLKILPELAPFFVTDHEPGVVHPSLGYGARQHLAEVAKSLTTTSSVVATLNSVLAGALASAVVALLDWATALVVVMGVGVSLISATLHVRYAARYRRGHVPSTFVVEDKSGS